MPQSDARLGGRFRHLRPRDEAAIAAHFLRLEPALRQSRFGVFCSDEVLTAHAHALATGPAFAEGYVEDGVLRAVAELHVSADRPRTAEAAFSVEAGWQRRGIGSRLMRRVLDVAGRLGVERVMVMCAHSNRMMRRLAQEAGFRLEVVGSEVFADRPVPPRTFPALFRQAVDASVEPAIAYLDVVADGIRGTGRGGARLPAEEAAGPDPQSPREGARIVGG